jgi:tetratricopeptide (TPR) repeat protein
MKEFRTAVIRNPDLSDARMELAGFYLEKNRYEEALAEYEEELESNPSSGAAKLKIGKIHMEMRKGDKAVRYLQEGLKSEPEGADAHADLARAHELLVQSDAAIRAYRRALELDPGLNRVRYVLGRLYRERGQPELARKEMETVRQTEERRQREHVEDIQLLTRGSRDAQPQR